MRHLDLLIDGKAVSTQDSTTALNPYDGSSVGEVARGGWEDMESALAAAHDAFQSWRNSPRHDRQKLLRRIAQLVREREDELVEIITLEVGKPVAWSKGEVMRLALTFDYAADLLTTWGHEAMPVDMDPRGDGYRCLVERFPIGVIFCITPYNWPYNLAAHKIAPALATGNTIVLKPSGQAALSTLTLAHLIHDAGCPPGVVNAVNCSPDIAQRGLEDPRVAMLSFTGSPPVGWKLKGLLNEKKVALELGADSSAIVHEDADLGWAAQRITAGGYGYAGQVCIAVQHVLVHESRYAEAKDRLVESTRACPTGDPRDSNVVCGPLIDSKAADKVMAWIAEAETKGAKVLVGSEREGNVVSPTLIEGTPAGARLSCEEVFGPVLTLSSYRNLDEAIAKVNSSELGINAGVFTHDIRVGERCFQEVEMGAVIVNDYPTLRFDNMPYGGVKKSGFGREGLRFTMDEMTEPKAMVTRAIPTPGSGTF